jgi:hypothetical protein
LYAINDRQFKGVTQMDCSYVGIAAVALNVWFFTVFITLALGVPKERTFAKVGWMFALIAFFLFQVQVLKDLDCVSPAVAGDAP